MVRNFVIDSVDVNLQRGLVGNPTPTRSSKR